VKKFATNSELIAASKRSLYRARAELCKYGAKRAEPKDPRAILLRSFQGNSKDASRFFSKTAFVSKPFATPSV
jgi:hypothetical protein